MWRGARCSCGEGLRTCIGRRFVALCEFFNDAAAVFELVCVREIYDFAHGNHLIARRMAVEHVREAVDEIKGRPDLLVACFWVMDH